VTAALVAGFAVVASTNWWAVATGRRPVVVATKPLATALLVAMAATAGSIDGGARLALVVAAVCGLLGDVALLFGGDVAFMAGLGSFAVGHAAFVVTAVLVGVTWTTALLAVPFLAVLLGWRFLPETVPGAGRAGGRPLMVAVVGYAAVISAMVLTATGTGRWAAAIGAMSFAASDWLLGYNRFVQPIRHAGVIVMVTYHLGQLLLILGLAA
jgi:uncharacterized membrane protein YhhN